MSSWRVRQRRKRRTVGLLLLATGSVLAWAGLAPSSFHRILSRHDALLTGLLADNDKEPALSPLAAPAPDAAADPTTGPTEKSATPITESPPVVHTPTSQPTTQPTSPLPRDLPVTMRTADSDLLATRDRLNKALAASPPTGPETEVIRKELADLANKTIFSRTTIKGDPLAESYVIVSGDILAKIAKRFVISEETLVELNQLRNRHFIRQGQRIKVLHGPFHATVIKSEHQLHLYLQDLYVRSYPVALGAGGSTPTGKWKVVNHQENPGWTDPRTGKRWHPDDPQNPIGEFWIGLEGMEGECVGQFGYGIHGTIEPETIGQDVSLGCVRLGAEDIAAVYRCLMIEESIVTIRD